MTVGSTTSQRGIEALIDRLGPAIVTRPEGLGNRKLADWSKLPAGRASALIEPRDTADVAAALAICHAHHLRVVAQGGLTGLAGAATILEREVALSLARMNAIEEIDTVSATMTVQAGAVLQAVQDSALTAGFHFPVDLGARGSATIGGAMATNAGGNRVVKYGMMRDQVLGAEAVLADGRVIGGLPKMLKNNAGYDLKNLLIGSEGTLAIITRAVLKILPGPIVASTAICGLRNFADVIELLHAARARLGGGVSAFEVMWPDYIAFVLKHGQTLRQPLAQPHNFYVLIETDGPGLPAQDEEFQDLLAGLLQRGVIEDAAIAMSERDTQDFWAIRDALGHLTAFLPHAKAFDISFAIGDLEQATTRIASGIERLAPDALTLFYGHLGDGNIHLVVGLPRADGDLAAAIETLVYDLVAELGGGISAEHGIGLKKRDVLNHSRSAEDLAVMRAIKQALDPREILGRDRIFRSTSSSAT